MSEQALKIDDLELEGFHCADCAQTIEQTVAKVGGVEKVRANFASGKVQVVYDPIRVELKELVRSVEKIGYRVRNDLHQDTGERRFWWDREFQFTVVSGLLLGLGLLATFVIPNPTLTQVLGRNISVAVLSFLASIFFGAYFFSREGWASLKNLRFNMDLLMSLAIVGAVIIQEYVEAASLAFLFSAAELMESYAVARARNSLRELMKLSPTEARVRRDGEETTVPSDQVEVGEIIIIRPGEKVAVDGEIVEGASSLDQSPITGESVPVSKREGDKVFAGSVNVEGYLEVRTTERSSGTMLARIIHMVEEAEAQKAPSQRFVEKFAKVYTPTVVGLAVLVAILPPIVLGAAFNPWFIKSLTLLVIACPCALVISTPVSVVSALTSASRNGVLIKGGVHLEEMAKVRVIALDKTGTLTKGQLAVTDVIALDGFPEQEFLRIAASIEQRSEHSIARAIVNSAIGLELEPVTDFVSLPGRGVQANLNGNAYFIGRQDFFEEKKIELPKEKLETLQEQGKTSMLLGTDTSVLGIIGLIDQVRDEAVEAVAQLQAAGKEVVMITGDNERTARAIAQQVGISHFHAGLLPDQKLAEIRSLRQKFGGVAMVGDGINDAPALAAASVGIAMGVAGTDTALETADVALMSDDLTKLPYLVELSAKARDVIRQNIFASILLKLSLAIGVFPGLVSLVVAVLVGDMGASLAVTSNALRLARTK